MNRNEAVTFLREVLRQCGDLSPQSVTFENPKEGESIGYRVRIIGYISEADMEKLNDIAKKHNLQVKKDDSGIVVYKLRANC